MNKNELFEAILREADKSRFLKPLWDEYSNDDPESMGYNDITYDALLAFINKDDPILQEKFKNHSINWQTKDKDYVKWLSIINAFIERNKKTREKEKSSAVYKAETLKDMILAADLKLAEQGDVAEYVDFYHLNSLDNETFDFYVPMTHEACEFCDSVKCGGQGAKWCLGYEATSLHWDEYTEDGNLFIFAFNKKEYKKRETVPSNKLKFMIQLNRYESSTRAWLQDDDHEKTIPIKKFSKVFGHSADELAKTFVNSIFSDSNVYSENSRGAFIDPSTFEYVCPWDEKNLKDNTFYLSEFYDGVFEKNPSEVFNRGEHGVVIDLEGQVVDPSRMNIINFMKKEFNIPEFCNWLSSNDVVDTTVTIENGNLGTVVWNTEKTHNQCNITFYNCVIDRVNFMNFTDDEYICCFESCLIKELYYPIKKEELENCNLDSIVLNYSSVKKEIFKN